MKTYNRFIALSIVAYVMCALLLMYAFNERTISKEREYIVDINRIMTFLQQDHELKDVDLTVYDNITSLDFLSIDTSDQKEVEKFYQEKNTSEMHINPWYQNNQLKGYIKFYYERQNNHINQMFYLTQGILALFEVIVLLFLWIMKRRIIKPFHQLSEMPYELSQGHFKKDVHIEKNLYFKDYLRGMSQLKDTLDISKKRQYELMKEKKQLLLSLSHDIKTPLNLIKLYCKTINENLCKDEASKTQALTQIEKKSEEIERYVETIIKSTKEDVVDFQVEKGEFYLSAFMEKVLNVYLEQCQIRNIQLRVNSYTDRLLQGDIHRAQEVMENLFENAFKYGDGKSIEIFFEEEEYHQLIHFRNSGSPLQSQELTHIFDSFFRGSNAQNTSGSGLGLYICKELMRKMDGAIYAILHEDGMEFVLVFK